MRVCRLCYLFIHSLPCTPRHLDVHLPSFLGKHKGFSVFSESLKLIKQTPQNGYHYLFNNKHKSKLEASCHLILVTEPLSSGTRSCPRIHNDRIELDNRISSKGPKETHYM